MRESHPTSGIARPSLEVGLYHFQSANSDTVTAVAQLPIPLRRPLTGRRSRKTVQSRPHYPQRCGPFVQPCMGPWLRSKLQACRVHSVKITSVTVGFRSYVTSPYRAWWYGRTHIAQTTPRIYLTFQACQDYAATLPGTARTGYERSPTPSSLLVISHRSGQLRPLHRCSSCAILCRRRSTSAFTCQ